MRSRVQLFAFRICVLFFHSLTHSLYRYRLCTVCIYSTLVCCFNCFFPVQCGLRCRTSQKNTPTFRYINHEQRLKSDPVSFLTFRGSHIRQFVQQYCTRGAFVVLVSFFFQLIHSFVQPKIVDTLQIARSI